MIQNSATATITTNVRPALTRGKANRAREAGGRPSGIGKKQRHAVVRSCCKEM
jgi:hypothetical protein